MRLDELRHSKERPVTRYWKDGERVPDGYQEMERNFYAPSFRSQETKDGRGSILGTIGDWLKEMGATPADIAPARELVLQSPEYKRAIRIRASRISRPTSRRRPAPSRSRCRSTHGIQRPSSFARCTSTATSGRTRVTTCTTPAAAGPSIR